MRVISLPNLEAPPLNENFFYDRAKYCHFLLAMGSVFLALPTSHPKGHQIFFHDRAGQTTHLPRIRQNSWKVPGHYNPVRVNNYAWHWNRNSIQQGISPLQGLLHWFWFLGSWGWKFFRQLLCIARGIHITVGQKTVPMFGCFAKIEVEQIKKIRK